PAHELERIDREVRVEAERVELVARREAARLEHLVVELVLHVANATTGDWLEQQTGVAYRPSSATTGSGCHERARAICVGSTTRIRRCSRLACPTVEHVC